MSDPVNSKTTARGSGSSRRSARPGPLAQLAERRADNAEVRGSSPRRPTTASVTRTGAVGIRKVGTMLSRLSTLTSTTSSLSRAFRWPGVLLSIASRRVSFTLRMTSAVGATSNSLASEDSRRAGQLMRIARPWTCASRFSLRKLRPTSIRRLSVTRTKVVGRRKVGMTESRLSQRSPDTPPRSPMHCSTRSLPAESS